MEKKYSPAPDTKTKHIGRRTKKAISVWLSILMMFNFIATTQLITALAEGVPEYELSVRVSQKNVKAGDTVKVTVGLKNYSDTRLEGIMGLQIDLPIDSDYLEYTQNSLKNVASDRHADDLYMLNGTSKRITYMYASMNGDENPISRGNTDLFEFSVTVKSDISKDRSVALNVSQFLVKDAAGNQNIIHVEDAPVLHVLVENPAVTLNGQAPAGGIYDDNVTIGFNKGTALICRDGQAPEQITDGYVADKNGSYEVTVTDAVGNQTTTRFSIVLGVSSISMKQLPAKTQYIEGTELDVSGGSVEVTYKNHTREVIPLTQAMCDTLHVGDFIGQRTVTVTHRERQTSFTIDIVAKSVSLIEMKDQPDKLQYIEGQDLDISGASIIVHYNNGTTGELLLTKEMVSGYKKDVIGDQTLTVTYQNKTTVFSVHVRAKQLSGIKITRQPDKTNYIEGQSFDPAGMTVTAAYDNGTAEVIGSYSVSADPLVLGQTSIQVTYQGHSADVAVIVRAKKLQSIMVAVNPVVDFKIGTEFKVDGGMLKLIYDNGTSETVAMTREMCSGYDMNTLGIQTVQVTYQACKTSYEIQVLDKTLAEITIKSQPSVKTFIEGTAFRTDGTLTLRYDNGSMQDIELTEGMCSGFDLNRIGTQTVIVTYGGKTASYEIRVIAKSVASISMKETPAKLQYIEGQELDVTGAIIWVHYNNGTVEEIDVTSDMVNGYDKNRIGDQTITVSYHSKSTTFSVHVRAKQLTGITIARQPDKQSYIEGQVFNPSGMVVRAEYDNGTSISVTDYHVPATPLARGQTSVLVQYQNQSAEVAITVHAKALSNISILKLPVKLTYIEGQNLDLTGGELLLTYDNGTTDSIRMTDSSVVAAGYNRNTTGSQTVTVTYQSKTAEFAVIVHAKKIVSLSVIQGPAKTTYIEGQDLDLAGGVIHAVYDNGTEADLRMTDVPLTVTGFNSMLIGRQTITISYQGFKAEFDVDVIEKSIINISLSSEPEQRIYLQGQSLSLMGAVITVSYDNGTAQTLDVTSGMISGYDKQNPSVQKITVTYRGYTALFEVTVLSRENVDKLIAAIDELERDALTLEDKNLVFSLRDIYQGMHPVEQAAVTNQDKLEQAVAAINALLYPAYHQSFDQIGRISVEIFAPVGMIPNDAQCFVHAAEPTKEMVGSLKTMFGIGSEFISLFDIRLKDSQGVSIQPNTENGRVTIKLAVPDLYRGNSSLAVICFGEDSAIIELPAEVKDGYAVFETETLTRFALIEKSSIPPADPNQPQEKPSVPDSADKDNPNTSHRFPAVPCIAIVVSSGALMVLCRKRQLVQK